MEFEGPEILVFLWAHPRRKVGTVGGRPAPPPAERKGRAGVGVLPQGRPLCALCIFQGSV